MNISELKKTAFDAIDHEREAIFRLSRYINENPETAFREEKAAAALTDFLFERGFSIERRIGGLDTAFAADYGPVEATADRDKAVPVAFVAEYDALPGIGHGCGHNLIAAAAVAAAIGTAAAVDISDSVLAQFRLVGTPAEEVLTEIAGKNRLINAGVFRNISNVLMFHPWGKTGVARKDLGCTAFRITFTGRPAHAAADPWNGRNALDAAVSFYNSISMLRQQLPSGMRLHCIISEGGDVLNIIPDHTVVEVVLRSTELEELITAEQRIRDCAGAAASAAGCSVNVDLTGGVKPILFDRHLFELAEANMNAAGEKLEELPIWEASSDFGDLSREMPALSLLYKTHDEQTCWHSAEAAAEAHTDSANTEMLKAAKILAATAIDLLLGKALVNK